MKFDLLELVLHCPAPIDYILSLKLGLLHLKGHRLVLAVESFDLPLELLYLRLRTLYDILHLRLQNRWLMCLVGC